PGGRLPGAGRAHVHRRPAPPGVLRRALPQREPDRGRRGAPPRRRVRLRGRLGVHRRGQAAGAAQGAPGVRIRRDEAAELQVNITLRVWRQKGKADEGRMVTYKVEDVSPDMSFLEMLDVLNEKLTLAGEDPVAFDHDCREGICGACGVVINGV